LIISLDCLGKQKSRQQSQGNNKPEHFCHLASPLFEKCLYEIDFRTFTKIERGKLKHQPGSFKDFLKNAYLSLLAFSKLRFAHKSQSE